MPIYYVGHCIKHTLAMRFMTEGPFELLGDTLSVRGQRVLPGRDLGVKGWPAQITDRTLTDSKGSHLQKEVKCFHGNFECLALTAQVATLFQGVLSIQQLSIDLPRSMAWAASAIYPV